MVDARRGSFFFVVVVAADCVCKQQRRQQRGQIRGGAFFLNPQTLRISGLVRKTAHRKCPKGIALWLLLIAFAVVLGMTNLWLLLIPSPPPPSALQQQQQQQHDRGRPESPRSPPQAPPKPKPKIDPKVVVWYFHHMPKCAGTAVGLAMQEKGRTFSTGVTRDDGIRGSSFSAERMPKPGSVVMGHWPAGVFSRYPQLLSDPARHKLFTIVRDPWDTRASLFWYHRRHRFIPRDTDLVKFMLSDPATMARIPPHHKTGRPNRYWYAQQPRVVNYLPYYFKCRNQTHCQDVLDRYAYIGVVGMPGMDPMLPLALLKNGGRGDAGDDGAEPGAPELRRINTRIKARDLDYRTEMARLDTPETRRQFASLNALEFWVYRECVRRFLAEWNRSLLPVPPPPPPSHAASTHHKKNKKKRKS